MSWKAISSGKLEESQIVYTGPCFYFGFSCVTGGESRTITLYDSLAASGTAIEDWVTTGTTEAEGNFYPSPITCSNGIYVAISGGSSIVYYTPLREGVQ